MPLKAQPVFPLDRVPALGFGDSGGLKDAMTVAKFVTWENYIRDTGTINRQGKWRVDAQLRPKTKANIQIQREGVRNAPSTIACVLVPLNLHDEIQRAALHRRPMMIQEFSRAVNAGLHESEKSWKLDGQGYKITVWEVTGNFSS